MQDTIWSEWFN